MSHIRIEPLRGYHVMEFLFMWVLATTVGLLVGNWLGAQFINVLWPAPSASHDAFVNAIITNAIPRVIIVGITTGTLIGVFQWLVFRHWGFRVNWKWMAASTFACVFFPALGIVFSNSIELSPFASASLLGGVFIGIAQWRILRQTVNYAGWWIFATTITSAYLFGSITPNPHNEPFTLFAGVIVGGITGVVLALLLTHPVHQPGVSFQQDHD